MHILVELTDIQYKLLTARYGEGHTSRHLVENAIKECVEEEIKIQPETPIFTAEPLDK